MTDGLTLDVFVFSTGHSIYISFGHFFNMIRISSTTIPEQALLLLRSVHRCRYVAAFCRPTTTNETRHSKPHMANYTKSKYCDLTRGTGNDARGNKLD